MADVSQVDLHVLCRETRTRLDAYSRAVQECKSLDAALDFCRFVTWSGLVQILKAHSNTGVLPIDGSHIEWKVRELQRQIQERYVSGDVKPQVDVAELERINYKLDLIAGQLSHLPLPKVDIAAVPLRLIEGGKP